MIDPILYILGGLVAWAIVGRLVWEVFMRLPLELPMWLEVVIGYLCGPILWWQMTSILGVWKEEEEFEKALIDKQIKEAAEDEERPGKYHM